MPQLNQKQLERYRATVTGIGWANTKQAALYTGLAHRTICDLIQEGEILYSRIGRKVRIKYTDLDTFMAANRAEGFSIKDLVKRIKTPGGTNATAKPHGRSF